MPLLSNLETLLYFAKEREAIRLRREGSLPHLSFVGPGDTGGPIWTEDPILATYRFCNVRRRDDRVSRWLREHVLTQQNINYDLRSFLQFSAWCRWVNWPPTIAAAMGEGFYPKKRIDWKKLGQFMDRRGKRQKVWTGAYMISAPRKKGGKKGKFVAEKVIGQELTKVLPQLTKMMREEPRSCEAAWKLLRQCEYHGGFMAGQIVADWSYTSLLENATDLYTWAPMGPGSVRGYNRIMGLTPITKRPKEEDWLAHLARCRTALVEHLGPGYETLSAMDCQNSNCEIDKYLRVSLNQGRPRAKYRPETAYSI